MDIATGNRLLRLPDVSKLTSLSKSTINLWVTQGKFPSPTALSATIKVWRFSDVEQWIDKVCSRDSDHPDAEKAPPSNVLTLATSPNAITSKTALAHSATSARTSRLREAAQ